MLIDIKETDSAMGFGWILFVDGQRVSDEPTRRKAINKAKKIAPDVVPTIWRENSNWNGYTTSEPRWIKEV